MGQGKEGVKDEGKKGGRKREIERWRRRTGWGKKGRRRKDEGKEGREEERMKEGSEKGWWKERR